MKYGWIISLISLIIYEFSLRGDNYFHLKLHFISPVWQPLTSKSPIKSSRAKSWLSKTTWSYIFFLFSSSHAIRASKCRPNSLKIYLHSGFGIGTASNCCRYPGALFWRFCLSQLSACTRRTSFNVTFLCQDSSLSRQPTSFAQLSYRRSNKLSLYHQEAHVTRKKELTSSRRAARKEALLLLALPVRSAKQEKFGDWFR